VQHVLSAVGAHQLTSFPPLVPFAGTGKNFEVELLSLPYPILLLKKKTKSHPRALVPPPSPTLPMAGGVALSPPHGHGPTSSFTGRCDGMTMMFFIHGTRGE
jgi:hypothetical protein